METLPIVTHIKTGFLLSFIFVVGIGAITFGYAGGVFNSMAINFYHVFDINGDEE